MRPLAFLDLETTSLDRFTCEPWEFGLILSDPDTDLADRTYRFLVKPDLTAADPKSLEMNGYWAVAAFAGRQNMLRVGYQHTLPQDVLGSEYQASGSGQPSPLHWTEPGPLAEWLALKLHGRTLVANNPCFDDPILERWLREHGQTWSWHYHRGDVRQRAIGWLRGCGVDIGGGDLPADLDDLPTGRISELCGVPTGAYGKHAAVADAQWLATLWWTVSTVSTQLD